MSVIRKVHDMLSGKEVSCNELTVKYLEKIEECNKDLNAYVTVTADIALEQAKKVDEKIANGEKIGLLEGVPMTLKDNLSTKGIETTCCSKMLVGYKPIYNATVWDNLKNQGAVLLGKTNMDEFAMGSTCENSYFGGALNPHNTNYCSGGSSGGGACAVSGNIAPYALGSDTGGSIRQPASFCGIVGLKPTYGAVSRYGLIAYASSLDQIGPITKTVEDASIVFDAISQYDALDSTCQGRQGGLTYSTINNHIKGVKIGVVREYFDGVRDDVKKAIFDAIKVFEDLGAEVVYFDMPVIKYALPAYYIIACAEASSNLGRYDGIRYGFKTQEYNGIHDMMCKTRSEGFGEEVKKRILLGTYVLSAGYYDAYYKKAQNIRGTVINSFNQAFEQCDFIVAPTVPMTAFESGKKLSPVETYLTDICTVPVNIAGLPAVSVPCGFDCNKMPIGMQLIGNKFSEAKILNAANMYEKNAVGNFMDTKWGVKL